jgi:tetratricopeptide (TPR) repeat protein
MVKAWREMVSIPTYEVGKAEKAPMFLEKRVYQGSSGVVYPYPVIESIANEPTPKEWHAVWLENEYILVMILPELGGRIQMAYDKLKKRHFVYYNHVIKPALVGLCGPWISGGIEFNWPQHHRPSTYSPVDCDIVDNDDGSVTVWVNEMERMFHQKGMAGFTLRPGCAYLEIQGRVSNRTPLPQTFLWWANPAVEVNDAYQSVFPPDVNAVFDHGKRAVSSFPIATGTYYKMDYSAGVDISNYKNIPVPTSYMAVNSKYDFEGGYENDTHGGMLHVASHHFSPGKKQWTWGNGDFGKAWDRNLTDSVPSKEQKGDMPDEQSSQTEESTTLQALHSKLTPGFRPYIELMAGVYTENQPDFTWLMPYEEKQFTQYFMPYREVGIVKQATSDFIFGINPCPPSSVEESSHAVQFKILATSKQTVRLVLCSQQGETFFNQTVTLTPEEVFEQTVNIRSADMSDLLFTILSSVPSHSSPLLSWQPEPDDIRPIPDAAEAALPPHDTKTNDQLYLTGLHLEQYRHATWSALDYYEEALRRDPNDVRCLNQTGLWYLRRGRFDTAEDYLRKAVKVWQKRNPNPYDGEAIFNLALALKYQGMAPNDNRPFDNRQIAEAYELFWKSTWNKAWADAGYFEAACISVGQQRYADALDELNRCLIFNSCHHKARALKAAVLRKLQEEKQTGKLQTGSSKELNERLALIKESLQLDRFNYGILYEQYLLTSDEEVLRHMVEMMHGAPNNYDELALDYTAAGLCDEARQIWHLAAQQGAATPMTWYYLFAFCHEEEALTKAGQADSYCCFPNRLDDIIALSAAKAYAATNSSISNSVAAKAPYYLGCLYYDKRQYDLAIDNWELSARLDPSFPTVWRNLALARFNKQGRQEEAVEYMEKAFHLDPTDARMLMELDQLYKRMQRPHQMRLSFLRQYSKLIQQRDDLVLEEITLLNQLGCYDEAMAAFNKHRFHPWEGGEGKVSAQYQICRVEIAKRSLAHISPSIPEPHYPVDIPLMSEELKAIRLLQDCLSYPHSLGEGKLFGAQENDFYYLLGMAYDAIGSKEKAINSWEKGTAGPTEPAAAMYYNDAKPDKIFYAALCYRALGQEDKARSLFNKLVSYGKQHVFDHVTMDYFAVSLPDLLVWEGSRANGLSELDLKNEIHCKYMLALGFCGLGDEAHAMRYLEEVEALDINHQGAMQLRSLITILSASFSTGNFLRNR